MSLSARDRPLTLSTPFWMSGTHRSEAPQIQRPGPDGIESSAGSSELGRPGRRTHGRSLRRPVQRSSRPRRQVRLYDLKSDHSTRGQARRSEPRRIVRREPPLQNSWRRRKTDFHRSFNFDPRSVLLNTEMGVLIDSPRMAGGLAAAFSEKYPRMSHVPD